MYQLNLCLLSEFVIERTAEFGGNAVFTDFSTLQKAFENKVRHARCLYSFFRFVLLKSVLCNKA